MKMTLTTACGCQRLVEVPNYHATHILVPLTGEHTQELFFNSTTVPSFTPVRVFVREDYYDHGTRFVRYVEKV